MTINDIREKVSSCTEKLDAETLNKIENGVIVGDISLEELYNIKEEIFALKESYIYIENELIKERELSFCEYYDLLDELKKLDSYENNRNNGMEKLITPSIVANIGVILSQLSVRISLSNILKMLLSTGIFTVVIDTILYRINCSKINRDLEKLGDLDDLLLRKYDAFERNKGLSGLLIKIDDKARCAVSNESMIEGLIDGLASEEKAKEYIK